VSLHGLQCGLAALFTSPSEREHYERDPQAFACRFALTEREGAQLDALARSAVASYAATLTRKRCAEAARLLPLVRDALNDAFFIYFEEWARRSLLPRGSRRYVRDALGFCAYLLASGSRLSPRAREVVAAQRRALQPGAWDFWRQHT